MRIESVANPIAAMASQQGGNVSPGSNQMEKTESPSRPSIRELAQSIDPNSMSRNEARQLADALMMAEVDLSIVFMSHSVVLVPEGDSYRSPVESDAVMNEKFNMFDAINGNIEYKKSEGLPIERDLAALAFLEKFKLMADVPMIDTYT